MLGHTFMAVLQLSAFGVQNSLLNNIMDNLFDKIVLSIVIGGIVTVIVLLVFVIGPAKLAQIDSAKQWAQENNCEYLGSPRDLHDVKFFDCNGEIRVKRF